MSSQIPQNSDFLKVKDTQGQASSSLVRADILNSKKSSLRIGLILNRNPYSLVVNCTRILASSLSIGSAPQRSSFPHFKYSIFSLPSSKVKFFRGSPCQTSGLPSLRKCDSDFDSSFSVSSVEDDHLGKLNELEDLSLKDPLGIDLNRLVSERRRFE